MIKRFRFLIIISIVFIITTSASAQVINQDSISQKVKDFTQFLLYRNHDSTYIKSYADKFTFRLLAIHKFNNFSLNDKEMDASLLYRPDKKVNLGFGIAYKWFAIDLAFNFGISENSDFENKETFDFQATVFGGMHYLSASYQYYYGYQLSEVNGVPVDSQPENEIRGDIRTAAMGLQYLFAYNYDQFSLKAPFIQNEIQRKSAGSWLLGAKFQLFTMDADSSVVPESAKPHFSQDAYLTNIYSSDVGVNLGYMYTFVLHGKFYLTLSAIPGIDVALGDFKTDIKKPISTKVSFSFISMNSLGYNADKFFCGVQLIGDINQMPLQRELAMRQTFGKLKFNVGYRFGK